MPEQDKERLPGKISATLSSDAAISRSLELIRSEIQGTNAETIEADIYKPEMIGSMTDFTNNNDDISPKPLSSVDKLSATDSAYASRIRQTRKERLKKTA